MLIIHLKFFQEIYPSPNHLQSLKLTQPQYFSHLQNLELQLQSINCKVTDPKIAQSEELVAIPEKQQIEIFLISLIYALQAINRITIIAILVEIQKLISNSRIRTNYRACQGIVMTIIKGKITQRLKKRHLLISLVIKRAIPRM